MHDLQQFGAAVQYAKPDVCVRVKVSQCCLLLQGKTYFELIPKRDFKEVAEALLEHPKVTQYEVCSPNQGVSCTSAVLACMPYWQPTLRSSHRLSTCGTEAEQSACIHNMHAESLFYE